MAFPMADLPPELWENIFLLTDDFNTWKSCSRVCRAFRGTSQALLFKQTDAFRLINQHPRHKFKHLYPHFRRVKLTVDAISKEKQGLQVKHFLAHLSNLQTLEFVSGGYMVSWASTGILGVLILSSGLSQLTTLRLDSLYEVPLLALLSVLPNLKHLALGWLGAEPSVNLEHVPSRMPQLQSLITYNWRYDIVFLQPLREALDLCSNALASITCSGHISEEALLSQIDNLFPRFSQTLTHLNIGPSIFRHAVDVDENSAYCLPLAELRHLKIFQFEFSKTYFDHNFWTIGHLISLWIARELSKIPSPSVLSRIVCDIAQEYRAISRAEIRSWPELDELLTSIDAFPDFAEFRWRLYQPGNGVITGFSSRLRTVLPLCSRRKFVCVETWKDRWEIVDSVVQECCR
ncbi:hypothetical protein DL96DRAFT_1704250 [Flagelloscypha sp. PMI_526]|nr:hypothetical protein DL96DRAFT_1704250 [Flagelloscypha sp. PMI_526]